MFNSKNDWEKYESEDEYAKGGVMPKGARSGIKIKNWYVKNYPTDELGEDINDTITFKGYWAMTSQGYNPYEVLGVDDSVVRERVDGKLSEILGVDNYEYKKGGKLVGNQKKLDVNKNGKLDAEDFKMLRGKKMADGGEITYYTDQQVEKMLTDVGYELNEDVFSEIAVNEGFKWNDKENMWYRTDDFAKGGTIRFVDEFTKQDGIEISTAKTEDGKTLYGAQVTMYPLQRIIPFTSQDKKDVIKRAKELKSEMAKYYKENNVGAYMAKGGKTPIVRTQFEEEEFEYADGGGIGFHNSVVLSNSTYYDVTITAEPKTDNRNWANFVTFDTRIQTKDKQEAIRKAKLEFYAMYPNEKIMKIVAEPDTSAYIPDMPGLAHGGEIVTDPADVQKIKNSIQEGELMLRAGKAYGRKLSKDELSSIRESVNRSRKKIGLDATKYSDGGVTDKEVAESNVHMLQSNIKSIKHHAEELENAIKGNTEVEGWVLAKADRAATAMSDITHYIDGRKMGTGGMVAGIYYKDKSGDELRFIGPDSSNDNMGIFKDGEKYVTKSYNDFEEEKSQKSFWFGNGGYMPSGLSRKVTLSEKAEQMVGSNTWHALDAAEKGEVIGELISDGALAVTMDRGGIVDAEDWEKSMTQDKVYALKKAGYSENIASEMSLLPYEQLPMWVKEDFRKGSIVIGDYHIHKNRMSSPIPLDMGKVLVLNGDEEVVYSAETLEQAKEWAINQMQEVEDEEGDYVWVSDCCGAPKGEITDLCPECFEHCGWEKMMYADGGVTEAVKFKVIYKLKDAAEPKEKMFDNAEKAEFFLETIQEDDDIESANLVEVKPEKKAAPAKAPTNLFAAAKPVAKTPASKKGKEDVFVPGIADEIARYDALKGIINNAKAEQEVIGGRLKETGKDKFLELYELRRRNPDTFNLADEDEKIMFIVMDKYKKVEPEKAAMLENYPDLLETVTTYKFNPDLLDRVGEIVSRLIMESTEISDEDKANLIVAETSVAIKKGTIDRLMDYDNPTQIFDLIEPILALK